MLLKEYLVEGVRSGVIASLRVLLKYVSQNTPMIFDVMFPCDAQLAIDSTSLLIYRHFFSCYTPFLIELV